MNSGYLEMNYIAENATGRGNNVQVIMEDLHDGTVKVTEGRVGIRIGRNKPHSFLISSDSWDDYVTGRLKRGYIITKKQRMDKREINKGGFADIEDENVRDIVSRLIQYANATIAQNYTTTIDDISDEMIDKAAEILQDLAKRKDTVSVVEFNNCLKILFAVIPRRIDNLSKVLAVSKSQINDILEDEQELFDLIVSQLRDNQIRITKQQTILEAKNMEWRPVTEEEKQHLLKMMGGSSSKYLQAWRVENLNTRKRFNDFCVKENLSGKDDVVELFHGSRSENFWSITTNGLTINPSGVVITGKMFGNGTYFAPKAQKSIGYTSSYNSRWANGNQSTGFLAVYDVATGKRFHPSSSDSSLNYAKLQKMCPGAHCTWATAASCGLINEEVIVYKDEQSSIKYLIEFVS